MAHWLFPCPDCGRHVRLEDSTCPFCQTAQPARVVPKLPSSARLSRARRVALGASLALSATACGGATQSGPGATPGGTPGGTPGATQPAPTGTATPEPPPDDGASVAEYGAPAPIDEPPAPPPDHGGMAPKYGMPPSH